MSRDEKLYWDYQKKRREENKRKEEKMNYPESSRYLEEAWNRDYNSRKGSAL